MLPTLFSRHYKEVKCRLTYKLPNHDLNLLKVYNALAYFQQNGTEQSYTRKDFEIESYYNAYSCPQSDPRTSYETREDIPYQEYAEFFDLDAYGYHLDYLQLYKSLLEKVKSSEDIEQKLTQFLDNEKILQKSSEQAKSYVKEQAGATQKIVNEITHFIL